MKSSTEEGENFPNLGSRIELYKDLLGSESVKFPLLDRN